MREKFALLIASLLFVLYAQAQPTPVLVKNINPLVSSSPRYFCEMNGKLYFIAVDGSNGPDKFLWVTDGSEQGTYKVSQVKMRPYPEGVPLIENNGLLYFAAENGTGEELWVSDGTEAGTRKLKEINATSSSWPKIFVKYKNKIFFNATDGIHGDKLWVSDGTESGTVMFKDILDADVNFPFRLSVFNNLLFFVITNSANDFELWVTDGNTNGTRKIDCSPFTEVNPFSLHGWNGKVYFSAKNDTTSQLWATDGTPSGTKPITDTSHSVDLDPQVMTNYSGQLFFNGYYKGNQVLWSSDGTPEGTNVWRDSNDQLIYNPDKLSSTSLGLFFSAGYASDNIELWITKGTKESTKQLKDINSLRSSYPSDFIEYHGKVYFSAAEVDNNRNMWESDGVTVEKVIAPSTKKTRDVSLLPFFTIFNDTLFFSADFDSLGFELYKLGIAKPKDSTLTMGELNASHQLTLYPNPAGNIVNIVIGGAEMNNIHIEIYTALGELLRPQQDYQTTTTGNTYIVNTATLKKGLYFVNITTENIAVTRRLVIE